ncbi:Hsp33 family molecular chaperone HslO [Aerococcus mictus]
MTDKLIKAISKDGFVRCSVIDAGDLVEDAHQRHDTWSAATAALGRTLIGTLLLALNSKDIQRIKLGVGHPKGKGSVVNHVLGKFSKEDQGKMLESSQAAADAISYWLEGNSFENTMNRFNN